MRTPSLQTRLIAAGVAVVVVVLVALDAFVYVNLRSNLLHNLEEVLDTRARLVRAEAGRLEPAELATFLSQLGLRAEVRGPEGRIYRADPLWRGIGDDLPPPGGEGDQDLVFRKVRLPRGGTAVLSVPRSGVDRALRRLAALEAAGTAAATVLAALILWRVSDVVLAPLGQVVAAARRTAAGQTGERLRPDRRHTRLGQMASAYDDMLDALEAALAEASEAEARSQRFLADAAHQLRTPITGAQACAETLLRGGSPLERDQLLVDLARETSRAARLMAGLLQVARLDQGQVLSPRPTELAALCAEEADRTRRFAPHLEVDVRASEDFPRFLILDPDAVREILANLLDNARRHASECIEIRVTTREGVAEVRVADDGEGLAEGALDRAFERFVSLDARGGSGLGLPIARGLARAHGGDLTYEDGVFLLCIPTEVGSAPRAEAGSTASA